jgi:lipid-binding SYLF domain-containing protein
MTQQMVTVTFFAWLLASAGSGCSTVPETASSRHALASQVERTIAIFKHSDRGIETFFQNAYGYAVLPQVAKGAFVIGGGHGQGHVFKQDEMIGYCSVSQASIGASIGAQTFREIIFFENARALERFCAEEFTFSAQVTAVALRAGEALKAKYRDGMAVFILMDTGLMADVSAGGQSFKFVPK